MLSVESACSHLACVLTVLLHRVQFLDPLAVPLMTISASKLQHSGHESRAHTVDQCKHQYYVITKLVAMHHLM
jgi:hypothetical protein